MPCPHNEITIVQRSQRQSAVAAAAYQSGEKLFCEYDQQVKHYPEKRGIVHNEILLPANAPQEYADRNTLWNAAEAVEKQWNSQLARRWVLTIPREIPPDQYAVLVREFCQKQFVSKGMIADFAIHDPHPPGHNPHAHVLLTMRAMDEHGKWLPKSRKVYDLDENGERIKLPSGRLKSHKEDTVDWNNQKYCEIWRHEWEVIQNRYLEANDRPERVDLRSYARQGLDIVPTVHEGSCCPADGKARYPDEYRQPEPGNQSCQQSDEVHPAAYPKPQRLDYRAGRKTERAACTKGGGGSNTSSQSADEVYGDTKGRTEGLDKGWTEPGDFTGLKGSQRSPILSPAKGLSTVEGLRSISGIFREISRRLPQSDEAKGSPQQSD